MRFGAFVRLLSASISQPFSSSRDRLALHPCGEGPADHRRPFHYGVGGDSAASEIAESFFFPRQR
jgi:hypothetical protein